ncbi:hypothetical protein NMY22_g10505 [Coprinellus aureogranulatus]|nr:hypothetical protein NMY22_g10505 [Coprinellus aureogranulatus]
MSECYGLSASDIPMSILGGVLYIAFMLLGGYTLLCLHQKWDLESRLACTSKTHLDDREVIEEEKGRVQKLSEEIEETAARMVTLRQRNQELESRVVEAELDLRRRDLEMESVELKSRVSHQAALSLSRQLAQNVAQMSDLKSRLKAMEAECDSWAHQIDRLTQEKEELEARSQRRQMKVLELQDKLTECYARLNERCIVGLSKSPFKLWGPPLLTAYDGAGRNGSSRTCSSDLSPSYSAPAPSPLK